MYAIAYNKKELKLLSIKVTMSKFMFIEFINK